MTTTNLTIHITELKNYLNWIDDFLDFRYHCGEIRKHSNLQYTKVNFYSFIKKIFIVKIEKPAILKIQSVIILHAHFLFALLLIFSMNLKIYKTTLDLIIVIITNQQPKCRII